MVSAEHISEPSSLASLSHAWTQWDFLPAVAEVMETQRLKVVRGTAK